MKIILYGKCDNELFTQISAEGVIAILEGTENLTVPKIQLPIIKKNELSCWKYDFILIGGDDTDEKFIELLRFLHVEEYKIRTLNDLLCERCIGNDYYIYYNEMCLDTFRQKGKYKVLVVSHDMSESGAPVALLEFTKILKKMGYQIFLYCQCCGPLVSEFNRIGIPVYVENLLDRSDLYFWLLRNDFCFAVVNTLLLYQLVQRLSETPLKVFWWLHECDNYYHAVCDLEGCMPELNQYVIPIFVGNKVKESFNKFYKTDIVYENLLYGLPDREINAAELKKSDKIVFALIGAIIYRKGQDIFLHAIEQLNEDIRSQCEFWIIGNSPHENSQLLKLIYMMGSMFPEIKYLGGLPFNDMQNLYEEIDVVVCPSRIDPMPVVVTEGLMNKKICLISDNIGTVQFMQDGQNGFIFPSENVAALSEKIEYIVKNYNAIGSIPEKGNEIYKEYFTNQKFEENLSLILKKHVEKNK